MLRALCSRDFRNENNRFPAPFTLIPVKTGHREFAELRSAVYVQGYEDADEVGELYNEWHRLNSAFSLAHLRALAMA
jgi:hypothetical protein